jgi:hypothetical protein
MRFPSSVEREPSIETWMHEHTGELGVIARRWFKVMRTCGDDVRELLHDGHPTACVGDAAFGYINAFRDHVNVGFLRGAERQCKTRLGLVRRPRFWIEWSIDLVPARWN